MRRLAGQAVRSVGAVG